MNEVEIVLNEKKMFVPGKDYSFLNPYSLNELLNSEAGFKNVSFGIDGSLLASILSVVLRKKVKRISFDYTSIAKKVFDSASREGLSVSLVGSEQIELDIFLSKIENEFPLLNVVYAQAGYFEVEELSDITNNVLNSDILICSMGAVRQENFIRTIRCAGFTGTSYTCGGFFRQYSFAQHEKYYPSWIDKYNLRAFYRMYKEPHTVKRYFINYPVSIIRIIYSVLTKKIKFTVLER